MTRAMSAATAVDLIALERSVLDAQASLSSAAEIALRLVQSDWPGAPARMNNALLALRQAQTHAHLILETLSLELWQAGRIEEEEEVSS